jgi:hypothetical protein
MQELLDTHPLISSGNFIVEGSSFTSATVLQPPAKSEVNEQRETKKRKREIDVEANGVHTQESNGACKYPGRIVMNTRLEEILELVKSETRIMNGLCVSFACSFYLAIHYELAV